MKYKQILKVNKLSNKDIANVFGLSYKSFINSSANKRYKQAIEKIYIIILKNIISKNNKFLEAKLNSLNLSTDTTKYEDQFLINLILK